MAQDSAHTTLVVLIVSQQKKKKCQENDAPPEKKSEKSSLPTSETPATILRRCLARSQKFRTLTNKDEQ